MSNATTTNVPEKDGADDEASEWRAFLLRWHYLYGDTHLTVVDLRRSVGYFAGGDPWNGCFPATRNGDLPSVKSLGRCLIAQVDCWRGDIVLRSALTSLSRGSRIYWVERPTT